MKYLKYDSATGHIHTWGTTNRLRAGMIQHNKDGSLADFYYDPEQGVVPKETGGLTWPGPTPADGETVARISGIPRGTHCTFHVNQQAHTYGVDDGALELVLHTAQRVTVTFWHPRWRHDPVEVVFT